MRYSWCFDLNHENAIIGGGEFGQVGSNILKLKFVKCDKDEPGYEDQKRICKSKSDIDKWFLGKIF